MEATTFLTLVENLTGTPVKEVTARELTLLEGRLDDAHPIDCSELNELLLLVNKDRVERPFFRHFFPAECKIADLPAAVQRFQRAAMLQYGNFIYAFRELSKIREMKALLEKLSPQTISPATLIERFKARRLPIVTTTQIARHETHFIGYLSAAEMIADGERVELLRKITSAATSWEAVDDAIRAATAPREHPVLLGIVQNYQLKAPGSLPSEFADSLAAIGVTVAERRKRLEVVRIIAAENQDIYLTWDHMDVYFATSMRKRWEYEDLAVFIDEVMRSEEISKLNVRHFDPTQAYTSNRINKGLVEALMLKRAQCTVYSVQDTDTLGKDSELAATLAQGKPVIAFVPEIDVDRRTDQLIRQSPSTIQERLRFILYEDKLTADEYAFLRSFHQLETYDAARTWRSLPDDEDAQLFLDANAEAFAKTCTIIANAERRIYDKRHTTLRDTHPLAIQVNLDTGVANGLLVVRTAAKCAELLRAVLTNSLELTIEEDAKSQMWYLRETISGCIYRVVTKDRKLTNCFWNFYLRNTNNNEV